MNRTPIMSRFRDMPIRQKLMVIITVATTAALLLSGVGIVIADSFLFRSYLISDLNTFARIIADNSTASLAFDDPQTATETLGALRVRKHIVAACLYRVDGTILASYLRESSGAACPAMPDSAESRSTLGSLTVSHPITLRDRRIGALMIRYDLGEMVERIRLYGGTVLIVLLASSLAALRLSSRLRDTFAMPILELAKTTNLVSEHKDYGLRARKLSNDEVGDLVSGFNEMLAGIQSRDNELRKSLADRDEALEKLAHLNRELWRSNEELGTLQRRPGAFCVRGEPRSSGAAANDVCVLATAREALSGCPWRGRKLHRSNSRRRPEDARPAPGSADLHGDRYGAG